MSIDRLIDSVWGEDAPTRAVVNVQVYVSKLRTLLQVDNSHQIVRRVPGHLLAASWLDLQQFRQLAARAAEGIRSHAGARRSRQRQRRWRRLGDICAALNWGNPVRWPGDGQLRRAWRFLVAGQADAASIRRINAVT